MFTPKFPLPQWAVFIVGILALPVLGGMDYFTGTEMSFYGFYLLPITLLGWRCGRRCAVMYATLCLLVWFAANRDVGLQHSSPYILYWNAFIRYFTFIYVAVLISTLRLLHDRNQNAARVDPLTGCLNSRGFYELAEREAERARRYGSSLTFGYVDVDRFKDINDQLGHKAGDQVLVAIARMLHAQLRRTDILGRLGGDEFAILLPEADGHAAEAVLQKIQQAVRDHARAEKCNISLSIGAVWTPLVPPALEDLVRAADGLMYTVKRAGRDSFRLETLNSGATIPQAKLEPAYPAEAK